MNIASFINPKCSVPLFSMEDINIAYQCGSISGKIIATFLTIIIVIVGLVKSTQQVTTVDTSTNKTIITKRPNYTLLSICALLLLAIWIVIPSVSGWTNSKTWSGYDEEIKSLMNQGLTRKEALTSVQNLFQQKMQSDSLRNSFSNRVNFNLNKSI